MRANRKTTVVLLIALPILLACLLLILPLPNPGTEGVHPALANLKTPFSVETEDYLDGGSIGLKIIDGNGKTNEFALPVSYKSGSRQYTNLVIGTLWVTNANAYPSAVLDDRTREFICYCIEVRGVELPGSRMMENLGLVYLRGAPRDYLRLLSISVLSRIVAIVEALKHEALQ